MDFLSNFAKNDEAKKPTSDQPNNPDGHHNKPSNSDLFSSAKLVAEAAQCHFRGEPEKYDKDKVTGAAADLLNCATDYGKLDESKEIGKYVAQVEDYLHKHQTTTTIGDSGEQKTTTTTATTDPTYDKDKMAGAAADLLNSATDYGKLDESKGIGKYDDQVEDYFHKHQTTTTTGDSGEQKTTTTTATTDTTNQHKDWLQRFH